MGESGDRMPINDRVAAVFDRLLDVDPDERQSLLTALCAGDEDLEREVRELLDADAQADELIPDPGSGGLSFAPAVEAPESSGRRFGNCIVTGVIAAGGMGMVYRAEQEQPQRTVAIKVIRTGLLSPSSVRRFELEASVLGRLQHPGIAQVYAAGVVREDDLEQPYIIMEHVDGRTLIDYADAQGLDVRGRLELLAHVCDAIDHAHANHVVHRDLKPGNILVTNDGHPKVLDFGVARVTDEAATSHTHTGQLLGTVQYMSPEQAAGRPDDTGVQTDVYALGIIGFELLTGRLPHDFRTPVVHDMVRVILNEEPTRLGHVAPSLAGDPETIIAKAIERDRDRRYVSAGAFAEDLRRWLRHEPVLARPASVAYRMSKFVRRNQLLCSSTAIVFVTLATAAVISMRSLVRSERTSAELQSHLRTSNVERGRLLGRDGSVAAAEDLIWSEHLALTASPDDDAERRHAHWALWELYAQFPCLHTVDAVRGSIVGLAWNADQTRVAWCDDAGLAWFDLGTTTVHRRATDAGTPRKIVFDDAGSVVIGYADGAVHRIRLDTDDHEVIAPDTDDAVTALAVTSGGQLAVGTRSGVLHLYRLGASDGPRSYDDQGEPISGVAFLTEDVVVSAGTTRVLRRDLTSDTVTTHAAVGAVVRDIQTAFAARGPRVVTASGNRIEVTLPDRRPTDRIVTHTSADRITDMAFCADDVLIAVSRDRTVRVLDLAHGTERILHGHAASVQHVAATPGAALVASGGTELKIWEVAPNAAWSMLETNDDAPHAVAFAPTGELLVVGGADGSVTSWSLDVDPVGRALRDAPPDGRPVPAVVFSPDGSRVYAGCYDGHLYGFDPRRADVQWSVRHPGGVSSVALRSDGAVVAVGGGEQDPHVRLWDTERGGVVGELRGHTRRIPSASFHPDGTRLATGSLDGTVRIWDVEQSVTLRTVAIGTPARAVAYHPSGSSLAYGTDTGQVVLLDPTNGDRRTVDAGTSRVFAIVFTQSGRLFATLMQGGQVKLWDAETLQPLATIDTPARPPLGIAFDATGERLAVSGGGAFLAVLDLHHYDRHVAGNVSAQRARQATRPRD